MKYYTEEGVYAVLDEGCSSTAHGSDWVTNAATKLGLQLLRPYSFKNPHGLLGKSMPVAEVLWQSSRFGVPGLRGSYACLVSPGCKEPTPYGHTELTTISKP